MSGLEAVGLVLGVLPLIISGAEHYRDGLNFVKRAIRRREFISQYRDELWLQRTLLGLYLKALICRTKLSPATQAELVEHPNSHSWRHPNVIKELSVALGEAHEPFSNLLRRISSLLVKHVRSQCNNSELSDDEIVGQLESLCLDAHKIEESPDASRAEIWKRLKFSWKHSERTALLLELKTCNVDLDRLSKAVDRAKPYERKQQSRRVHETFQLRGPSEQLYEIICKSCNCQPSKPRSVGLGLQIHTNVNGEETDPSFHLLLFDAHHQVCELSARIIASQIRPPPKKRVRIGLVGSLPKQTEPRNMTKLIDLCKEGVLAQQGKGRIELLVDESGEIFSSHDFSTSRAATDEKQIMSLCDIMSDLKLYERKTWLHREKAILAVILAYSLLQLHESSWLRSVWDSESLAFFGLNASKNGTEINPDRRVELRKPFTKSVVSYPSIVIASDTSTKTLGKRNAHIHALGIVLLELYLNRSIGVEAKTAGSDRRTLAQDLMEEHSDDFSMKPEYLHATRFCLCPHPNPFSGSFSFEDEGFREIFYTEVISKLEDNLMANFGVSDGAWLTQ